MSMVLNLRGYGEVATFIGLTKAGWKPKKDASHVKGNPDFVCSENRRVEAKAINMDIVVILYGHQVKRWKELIDEGKKVFLVITNGKYISKLMDVSKISFMEFMEGYVKIAFDDEYGVDVWDDQEPIRVLPEQQSIS